MVAKTIIRTKIHVFNIILLFFNSHLLKSFSYTSFKTAIYLTYITSHIFLLFSK